jgi:hypothetical protein
MRRYTHLTSGLPVTREEPPQLAVADFPEPDFWPPTTNSLHLLQAAVNACKITGSVSVDYNCAHDGYSLWYETRAV